MPWHTSSCPTQVGRAAPDRRSAREIIPGGGIGRVIVRLLSIADEASDDDEPTIRIA